MNWFYFILKEAGAFSDKRSILYVNRRVLGLHGLKKQNHLTTYLCELLHNKVHAILSGPGRDNIW